MTRATLYATTIALSLMFAAQTAAQADVYDKPACRLSVEALNDTGRPAPAADALPPGCETSTLPWSAPVGHRQPQLGDVLSSRTSSIDQEIKEENAKIDRLIKGVCRGC
jgi:hypothetical protein